MTLLDIPLVNIGCIGLVTRIKLKIYTEGLPISVEVWIHLCSETFMNQMMGFVTSSLVPVLWPPLHESVLAFLTIVVLVSLTTPVDLFMASSVLVLLPSSVLVLLPFTVICRYICQLIVILSDIIDYMHRTSMHHRVVCTLYMDKDNMTRGWSQMKAIMKSNLL